MLFNKVMERVKINKFYFTINQFEDDSHEPTELKSFDESDIKPTMEFKEAMGNCLMQTSQIYEQVYMAKCEVK